jgi:hypothetical protein
MSHPEDDRDLKAAFSALRGAEQEQLPPFAEVVRRGRARRDNRVPWRPGLRWAAAVGIVVAVLAARLGLRTPGPRVLTGPSPSLAEWRSPTAFLLETSGREVLTAPAGWDRSRIDLRGDALAPSPKERRFTS